MFRTFFKWIQKRRLINGEIDYYVHEPRVATVQEIQYALGVALYNFIMGYEATYGKGKHEKP